MSFCPSLLLFATLALVIYNVVAYYRATGSVAQRLAAAWKGSLTIFTAIWATIVSYVVSGLDGLSQITGQPEFKTIADGVKNVMTPTVQQYIATLLPAAVAALVVWSRMRTLGKH